MWLRLRGVLEACFIVTAWNERVRVGLLQWEDLTLLLRSEQRPGETRGMALDLNWQTNAREKATVLGSNRAVQQWVLLLNTLHSRNKVRCAFYVLYFRSVCSSIFFLSTLFVLHLIFICCISSTFFSKQYFKNVEVQLLCFHSIAEPKLIKSRPAIYAKTRLTIDSLVSGTVVKCFFFEHYTEYTVYFSIQTKRVHFTRMDLVTGLGKSILAMHKGEKAVPIALHYWSIWKTTL